MSKQGLLHILNKVDALPPLPAAVAKLCELTDNPDSKIQELVSAISSDQALAARILRVANSAFFGMPQQVSTISQAIMILGFKGVRDLALGMSVMNQFQNGQAPPELREEFWKHSLAVASAARLLSTNLRSTSMEEAFVAGLLHDIGQIFLVEYFTPLYLELIKKSKEDHKSLVLMERQIFSMDHAGVAQELCRHWKIPLNLTQAISDHHHLMTDMLPVLPAQHLSVVVRIADKLAKISRLGFNGSPYVEEDFLQDMKRIDILPEYVQRTISVLPYELRKTEVLLGRQIKPSVSPHFDDENPPTVLLYFKSQEQRTIMSIVLASFGCKVRITPEFDGTLDKGIEGVITDTAISSSLAESCAKMNIPLLDYGQWLQYNRPVGEGLINIDNLHTWLVKELTSKIMAKMPMV